MVRVLDNRSKECGLAIVEFCIAIPVLVVLCLFISRFGSLAYSYLNLTRAVHEGVMRGIRMDPLAAGADLTPAHDAIKARVQNAIDVYAQFGKLSGIDLNSLEIHTEVPDASDPRRGTVRVWVRARSQQGLGLPPTVLAEGVGDVI